MAEDDKQTEDPKTEKPEAKAAAEPTKAKGGDKPDKQTVPAKFKKLVDEVSALSALELSELVKVLEGHFGVSAAAPMAVAAAPGGAEGGDEAAEAGKSEYTINMTDAGASKINVIKAVREVTGLGLAESKAIVDSAPKVVKEKVPKEEAEEAKKKLEEAGAKIELE